MGDGFTPEQAEFLRQFADHYRAGRRVMCSFAHLVALLGSVAAAVEAYVLVFYHH